MTSTQPDLFLPSHGVPGRTDGWEYEPDVGRGFCVPPEAGDDNGDLPRSWTLWLGDLMHLMERFDDLGDIAISDPRNDQLWRERAYAVLGGKVFELLDALDSTLFALLMESPQYDRGEV